MCLGKGYPAERTDGDHDERRRLPCGQQHEAGKRDPEVPWTLAGALVFANEPVSKSHADPFQMFLPQSLLGHTTTTGRSANRRELSVRPSRKYRCTDCIGVSERSIVIDRSSTSTRRPVKRGLSFGFRPNLDGPKS
jgi:hypothetical protein